MDESVAAFAAADRANPPKTGGVVFIGSSSIRLWDNLEEQLAGRAIIRRGFGGSTLADCVRYVGRLVLPYRPRLVVIYAGDNDVAQGALATEVLERFKQFVEGVRAELPDTRIAFISIKPSPARLGRMSTIRRANSLVKAYIADKPYLDYIDIFHPMLNAEGLPRPELFSPDELHLNSSGYALWESVVAPYVR
jgi:lysophospholipase L1-like esterase